LEQIVGRSLHSRYEAVQNILKEWKQQRAKRETEFKNLLSQINNLRIRFGDVVLAATYSPRKVCAMFRAVNADVCPQSDISSRNLQKLSEELEKCKAEKMNRERHLATSLSKLRSICLKLGENDIDIAAMAHPSLRFYREALPGSLLGLQSQRRYYVQINFRWSVLRSLISLGYRETFDRRILNWI